MAGERAPAHQRVMIPRGARALWRDPCATLRRVRWLIVLPFARPGLMGTDFGAELRELGHEVRLFAYRRDNPLYKNTPTKAAYQLWILRRLERVCLRYRPDVGAGDQGRPDHARPRATDQGAPGRRLRQLLPRQPAVDDPLRVHRGLRRVLHQGALRHAQPAGRRPPQPALPADVLRAEPAPSGDPDARGGRALRRGGLPRRQPLRLPRAARARAGRLPAPRVGGRLVARGGPGAARPGGRRARVRARQALRVRGLDACR